MTHGKTIAFKKRKFILGCILGLISFLICTVFYKWQPGVFFCITFTIIGSIKINTNDKLCFFRLFWCAFAIIMICSSTQLLLGAGMLWDLASYYIALELVTATIVFLFIYIITLNELLTYIVSSFLLLSLSIINHYVYTFRGNEFTPYDIMSFKTALNVSNQYTFTINENLCHAFFVWGLVLFSYFSFTWQKHYHSKDKLFRLIYSVCECLLIALWYFCCSNTYIYTWDNHGTLFSGYLVNFSAQTVEIFKDKKPANYSNDAIQNLEDKYLQSTQKNHSTPNIIVIMNESFSDLSVLGSEPNTNPPATPFYDSLQDNTIKGYALCSTFAGGTANSEYEFLTGNSMGFINQNATAYQLYLNEPNYSIAQYLKNLGYSCIATHPYHSSGWSRTRAWPYLGFDEITFLDNYPQKNLLRTYVSDQEMFEYIIKKTEEHTDTPLFLFGVSMQNHSDYDYVGENYTPSIFLEGYNNPPSDVEQYLNLIHETDTALKYLINYYKSVDEDTIILFFGDHLPRLNPSFYEELHGGTFNTLEEQQLQYTVPFFLWANYDIPEESVEMTSLNYLSNYIFQVANIELPPYNKFLMDTAKTIPALNAFGYYSKDLKKYVKYEEASSNEKEALESYEILQYNSIFEKDESQSTIFSSFIN